MPAEKRVEEEQFHPETGQPLTPNDEHYKAPAAPKAKPEKASADDPNNKLPTDAEGKIAAREKAARKGEK